MLLPCAMKASPKPTCPASSLSRHPPTLTLSGRSGPLRGSDVHSIHPSSRPTNTPPDDRRLYISFPTPSITLLDAAALCDEGASTHAPSCQFKPLPLSRSHPPGCCYHARQRDPQHPRARPLQPLLPGNLPSLFTTHLDATARRDNDVPSTTPRNQPSHHQPTQPTVQLRNRRTWMLLPCAMMASDTLQLRTVAGGSTRGEV